MVAFIPQRALLWYILSARELVVFPPGGKLLSLPDSVESWKSPASQDSGDFFVGVAIKFIAKNFSVVNLQQKGYRA